MTEIQSVYQSNFTLTDLADVASSLVTDFMKVPNFVVWVQGMVGAGKSTLIRECLYQLGLSRTVPVQSPTFTYFFEYQIKNRKFAHCDFYRETSKKISDEQLSLFDFTDYRGVFIEWPEQLNRVEIFIPTHRVTLRTIDAKTRILKLECD